MKPREVMAEVARLAAERGWEEGSPNEVFLLGLFAAREESRRSLLAHTRALRADLTNLEQMLERPSPLLNTLGELQQRPAAVEAAVGAFDAADKALREYVKAFPAKGA
jgi:hypothetical protein